MTTTPAGSPGDAALFAGDAKQPAGNPLEVLAVATRLGLTSFGGPVAHLGYFRNEYVERRKWLSEEAYAEVVALSQALPGPASSQVGIAIGILRAGLLGGICAWIGFTLPSVLVLIAFAFGVKEIGNVGESAWIHGLKLSAVAIVAFAVWGMARNLASDRQRATIAVASAVVALAWQTAFAQVAIIVIAGVVGWRLFATIATPGVAHLRVPIGRKVAAGSWVAFFALLFGLPAVATIADRQGVDLFDSMYRAGSLVFGGGHVVLPLLEREVVAPGWVTKDEFLAGYGAAQAVPGPLFTLSAYLGAVSGPEPNGVAGAAVAVVAIFLPSFLLIIGGLPLWSFFMRSPNFQASLRGINAAVVGLLLAALYDPVWTSAVHEASDFALAAIGMLLLVSWKAPPLLVVAVVTVGAVVVDAF